MRRVGSVRLAALRRRVPPLVPVSPFPSRAPTWKPDGERRMTVRGDSWTAGEMRDWVGAGRTAASGRARLVGARR